MLLKVLLFGLLWRIVGNPFLALLILLVILYFLDRRYVGLTPNLTKPFQLSRRAARLRADLHANPHNTSAKLELARILIERKKYQEALPYLQDALPMMQDSADVHYEIGLCLLKTGDLAQGETYMLEAVNLNPRVKYGEAYLQLGEALAKQAPERAVRLLEQFRDVHSSSVEAYYRLGQLYQQLGRQDDAKRAFGEALEIYRGLPRYSRRQQRRWAWLARLK
ncbi:tetratricopeptide repeat protein [Paenibacillus whitsoniae]|uniref:Tetratricopeptide repeat protein n=1 Tax=Paenibacillus whitsoniae TaxID=2496558 RepID=A0A430JG64_9BACL|nr:tetratricopeptide repeat protein [Paenibacillus whitsoniae]RTE10042.1 tetratricopeptide repeat protein [Paenibacillus whitsoniae]